jgi:hypothetical protein
MTTVRNDSDFGSDVTLEDINGDRSTRTAKSVVGIRDIFIF